MMEGHRVRGHWAAQWGWQAGEEPVGLAGPCWLGTGPSGSSLQPLWLGSLGLGWKGWGSFSVIPNVILGEAVLWQMV